MTLGWLTYDDFAGLLGDRFVTTCDGRDVELELVDAWQSSELGGTGPQGQQRRQFSLTFRGPEQPMLPAGTVQLRHQGLGELALFLSALGPEADGMRYEAAFA